MVMQPRQGGGPEAPVPMVLLCVPLDKLAHPHPGAHSRPSHALPDPRRRRHRGDAVRALAVVMAPCNTPSGRGTVPRAGGSGRGPRGAPSQGGAH